MAQQLPGELDQLQQLLGRWATATFPHSTIRSKARHIFREAVELVLATHQDDDPAILSQELIVDLHREIAKSTAGGPGAVGAESADLLILLLHLAYAEEYSLLAATEAKFAEVLGRRWGAPDAAGVVEHERAASATR